MGYDHQIKIGDTTKNLVLLKDEDGSAMYEVIEDMPDYDSQLRFIQEEWISGHGQEEMYEIATLDRVRLRRTESQSGDLRLAITSLLAIARHLPSCHCEETCDEAIPTNF